MIRHTVLMKFLNPEDRHEARRLLEGLTTQVPELRSLEVGLDSLGLEGSFHLALATTHDSADDLAAYQEHPAHVEFRRWVGPRLAARAAVDVDSDDEVRRP